MKSDHASSPFSVVIEEGDSRLFRHPDAVRARYEAQRLARANPGKLFFVVSVLAAYSVPSPMKEENFVIDEIPF